MGEHPYFPLFVDLSGKRAVVVGGGRIAARRVGTLVSFCGNITVVAPDIAPEIEALAGDGSLCILRREFEAADADGAQIVLAATDDPEVNDAVVRACRERGVPVNHAGDRSQSDFYFPGVVRQGDVVIGVTASGHDHAGAKRVTDGIRDWLPIYFGQNRENGE